jgi:CRISPR-associated protein Csb1
LNGREAWCVLVDSVQSQANRLEEALLSALREGVIRLSYVTVDFSEAGLTGITEITSLEAPHRVYDAILRDSSLNGQPFMKGELGIRLAEAKLGNATALLETSPTALLLGVNHSARGQPACSAWPCCIDCDAGPTWPAREVAGTGRGLRTKRVRLLLADLERAGEPCQHPRSA